MVDELKEKDVSLKVFGSTPDPTFAKHRGFGRHNACFDQANASLEIPGSVHIADAIPSQGTIDNS